MKQKTFAAFGHYVIRNEIKAGEIINDDIYSNGIVNIKDSFDTCWLYTKGKVNQVNIATGETSVRSAGYCNINPRESIGLWRADFIEDSTVFCVPPKNNGLIESLNVFILAAGQSTTVPNGTKLSLCQGSISIGDKTVPEMRQIEFKNGSRVVLAVEDCYGFIFP